MADVNSTLLEVCNEIALALQVKLNTDDKFKPINYAARVLDIGSEANATASDVKLGKKVYVGDDYVDGTFTGEDVTIQNDDVGIIQVELTPEDGKYYRKVIIPAQPGLIASNIKKGVTIFGITGTLEEQPALTKLDRPVIELVAGGLTIINPLDGSLWPATYQTNTGFLDQTYTYQYTFDGDMPTQVSIDDGEFGETASKVLLTGGHAKVTLTVTNSGLMTIVMEADGGYVYDAQPTVAINFKNDSGQASDTIVANCYIDVCLAAGMKIKTASGYKLVEDVKEGDVVLAYDESTGEIVEDEVVLTHLQNGSDGVYDFTLENGEIVSMTNTHGVLTKDGWKCLTPGSQTNKTIVKTQLGIGDSFKTLSGYSKLTNIAWRSERQPVYHLSLKTMHCLIVSTNEIDYAVVEHLHQETYDVMATDVY